MLEIKKYQEQIISLCNDLPVKRLGLFGSALTEHFTEASDVDVLVVFNREENIDIFNAYFLLKDKLETIFNRSVDVVIDKKFKNPYFQKVINRTRKIIYER